MGGVTGMAVERAGRLVMGEYTESFDLPHFAAALGGPIAVRPPADEATVQRAQVLRRRAIGHAR